MLHANPILAQARVDLVENAEFRSRSFPANRSRLGGTEAEALNAAYDDIEDQEDEHLYQTKGWCRELWLQSLNDPVLSPLEERLHVKTAMGAPRAEQASEKAR